MKKLSAGILAFRRNRSGEIEVFLIHPGGPFFARKDAGAWSIPKGGCNENEDPLAAARREFQEETGFTAEGELLALGLVKQSSAKTVAVWALEGDFNPAFFSSNTFELEWPPKSGRLQAFPEADRCAWFSVPDARRMLIAGQVEFLNRLTAKLKTD